MGRQVRQLRLRHTGLAVPVAGVGVAASVLFFASAALPADEPRVKLPCNLTNDSTHSVVAIKDARTIVIDDGSVVELSGILPPFAPRTGNVRDVRSLEQDAIQALGGLVLGRAVVLSYVRPKRSRYGTLQAHVFIVAGADGMAGASGTNAGDRRRGWVQESLLSRGFVRAYEPAGQSDCFGKLVSFERRARDGGLGLWAHPLYRSISAGDLSKLWQARGSYVRVVGRIRRVARRSTHTYLNFGDNWRTDFTIAVPRRFARAHPAWAARLEGMALRTVEIAGWLVAKNGPSIEPEHVEQLQVLE